MRSMGILAAALWVAACSQAPQEQAAPTPPAEASPPAVASAEAEREAIAGALRAALAADLGKPVELRVDALRTDGDWAWVEALPQAPGGAAFDFTGTRYEQREAEGVLDGGGATYALLKRNGEAWGVIEFVVGPTDVAWSDWPARHGAPAALMGLPPNP